MASSPVPSGRPRVIAVVQAACTGCNSCVDYCLVDCIEPASAASGQRPATSITIREDECIGCAICAKVCDTLDRHAIRLTPAPIPSSRHPLK